MKFWVNFSDSTCEINVFYEKKFFKTHLLSTLLMNEKLLKKNDFYQHYPNRKCLITKNLQFCREFFAEQNEL